MDERERYREIIEENIEYEIMKDRPDGDRKAARARRADALGAARGEKADQFLSKQWNF